MPTHSLLFFGSFLKYSAEVLEQLVSAPNLRVVGVVTTPPQPAGRKQELKYTHTHLKANQHQIPVFTPETLDESTLSQIEKQIGLVPEISLVAGYGKILPEEWLNFPKFSSLNIHLSALPSFRGANPAEWSLLMNSQETGVTLIEMSTKVDAGAMIAQQKIPIEPEDTRLSIYQKLYGLGGQLAIKAIPAYLDFKNGDNAANTKLSLQGAELWLPPVAQPTKSPTPYAKRLFRKDGFFAWEIIKSALDGKIWGQNHNHKEDFSESMESILELDNSQLDAVFLERAVRALKDFPGVWTIVPTSRGQKRLKIHQASLSQDQKRLILEKVQLEGQQTALWNQVKNAISKEEETEV